ncbi:unnamed protein product [Rotaria sp. Silwood2]|nr:unnamed protein product [Rotaria sp. Silwood2]
MKSLSTSEIYNVSSNTWSPDTQMLVACAGYAASSLLSEKVLVIGGGYNEDYLSSCELYNSSSNTESLAANMSSPRVYHTASLLPSGKVLVAGDYGLSLGEIILKLSILASSKHISKSKLFNKKKQFEASIFSMIKTKTLQNNFSTNSSSTVVIIESHSQSLANDDMKAATTGQIDTSNK